MLRGAAGYCRMCGVMRGDAANLFARRWCCPLCGAACQAMQGPGEHPSGRCSPSAPEHPTRRPKVMPVLFITPFPTKLPSTRLRHSSIPLPIRPGESPRCHKHPLGYKGPRPRAQRGEFSPQKRLRQLSASRELLHACSHILKQHPVNYLQQ